MMSDVKDRHLIAINSDVKDRHLIAIIINDVKDSLLQSTIQLIKLINQWGEKQRTTQEHIMNDSQVLPYCVQVY